MDFTLLDVRKPGNSVGRDAIPKSIQRIEQHRDLITKRLIRGTITRMRRFDMNGKVKPKKLKLAEFAILDESERPKGSWTEGLRTLVPTQPALRDEVSDGLYPLSLGPFESERLYRFGGFSSDSE
jgi:hypothetical protein